MSTPALKLITTKKAYERFEHFALNKKGRVTLSVAVDGGNCSVGMSFCHPREQFSKRVGRDISFRRRLAGRNFTFAFIRNDKRLIDQVRDEFEKVVMQDNEAPKWAIYALKREIKRRNRAA